MYAVSFIYSNLILHCFPFSSFQGKFFSLQGQCTFSLLPPSMVVFSITIIDFLIAHKCDHSFGSLLPSEIQSQAFVFSPFGGWQGGSGPWGRLPGREYKTDRYSSSIARPLGDAREEECSKNAPIYTSPTTPHNPPPYQGILNRYSPLQEILQCWRACMP